MKSKDWKPVLQGLGFGLIVGLIIFGDALAEFLA